MPTIFCPKCRTSLEVTESFAHYKGRVKCRKCGAVFKSDEARRSATVNPEAPATIFGEEHPSSPSSPADPARARPWKPFALVGAATILGLSVVALLGVYQRKDIQERADQLARQQSEGKRALVEERQRQETADRARSESERVQIEQERQKLEEERLRLEAARAALEQERLLHVRLAEDERKRKEDLLRQQVDAEKKRIEEARRLAALELTKRREESSKAALRAINEYELTASVPDQIDFRQGVFLARLIHIKYTKGELTKEFFLSFRDPVQWRAAATAIRIGGDFIPPDSDKTIREAYQAALDLLGK